MDIKALVPLLIQISTILIIFAVGLRSRWVDLTYVIARPSVLLRGFAAVYVTVPLAAFVAASVLPIEPAAKIGIVAMALSPLAPLAPGKMLKCGADGPFVIGVYVGLLVLAVIAVPAALALVTAVTGGQAYISIATVTWLVATSILAPLAVGIAVGSAMPAAALKISRIASLVGDGTLAIIILLIVIMAADQLIALIGNGTLAAIAFAEIAGLAVGHVLGGPVPQERIALAFAAAMRHPGLAALMVKQNFDDQGPILAAVVLYLLIGVIVSSLYGGWARRRLNPDGLVRA
jgi:BASS family bile acid:Na+ symporter